MNHKFLPQREEKHRNFLSKAHYPLDQLPPFALGNFYMLSADNTMFLADNSRVLRPVGTLEDLSVAVWMMGLQVFPTHMSGVCDLERCLYDGSLYSTDDASSCKGAGESRLIAIAGLKDPFEFELLFNYTRYRAAYYQECNHRDALLVLKATIEEMRRRKHGMQPNNDLALLVTAFSSVSVGANTGSSSRDESDDPPPASPFPAVSSVVNVVVGCNSLYAVGLLRDIISTIIMSSVSDAHWFYLKEDRMMKFEIDHNHVVLSLTEDDYHSLRQHPPILILSALDLAFTATGMSSADIRSGILRADLMWTPESDLLLQQAAAVVQPGSVVILSGEPIDLSIMPDSSMRWIDLLLLTISDDKFLPRWAAFPAAQPNGRSDTIPALHLPVLTSSFHEMRRAAADQRIGGSHCGMIAYSPFDLLSSFPHRRVRVDSECEETSGTKRTRGVAYLYRNCNRPLRELFFSTLLFSFESSGIVGEVEAIGACIGVGQLKSVTDRASVERTRFTSSYIDRAIEIYRDFKFVIAFENNAVKGYITEKLSNAYLAGTIPIYWGAPDVNEYFNPDSMINCNHFESLQDCANRVIEVYSNATLYETMASAVPMLGNDEQTRYENWRRLFPWYTAPTSDSEWSASDAVHRLVSTEYSLKFEAVLLDALAGDGTKGERRSGR